MLLNAGKMIPAVHEQMIVVCIVITIFGSIVALPSGRFHDASERNQYNPAFNWSSTTLASLVPKALPLNHVQDAWEIVLLLDHREVTLQIVESLLAF